MHVTPWCNSICVATIDETKYMLTLFSLEKKGSLNTKVRLWFFFRQSKLRMVLPQSLNVVSQFFSKSSFLVTTDSFQRQVMLKNLVSLAFDCFYISAIF